MKLKISNSSWMKVAKKVNLGRSISISWRKRIEHIRLKMIAWTTLRWSLMKVRRSWGLVKNQRKRIRKHWLTKKANCWEGINGLITSYLRWYCVKAMRTYRAIIKIEILRRFFTTQSTWQFEISVWTWNAGMKSIWLGWFLSRLERETLKNERRYWQILIVKQVRLG